MRSCFDSRHTAHAVVIQLVRFLAEPARQTFNCWIPLYLFSVRHMNLKEIALFGWVPFLAADLGCVVGGCLAPFFMRRLNASLINSRKLVIICGTVLMVGPAFAHQSVSGALFTLASDVFGQHEVGTATGFSGMFGWLGGMFFSLIVGALAATLGYSPLFVCRMLFDVIGATVAWKLITHGEPSTPARAAAHADIAERQTSGR